MFRAVSLLLIGGLFGLGLAISGMLNPAKVAGFLDLFGVWDPSLAFVMGGGVIANFIGHRVVDSDQQQDRWQAAVGGSPVWNWLGPGRAVPGTGGRLACDGAG